MEIRFTQFFLQAIRKAVRSRPDCTGQPCADLESVRKLAKSQRERRDSVGLSCSISLALLFAVPELAFAASWQAPEEITATAERFMKNRVGRTAAGTSVSANGFDNRNRLTRCDVPLEGFLRDGTQVRARTIVGVRCPGSSPWKVYVPVDVVVLSDVLVAGKPLPRGHVLTTSDVRIERRDVSKLRRGYLDSLESLSGQRLKAPVMAGSVLTPSVLEADQVVRRGQSVTLIANVGGISVSMSGKALSDGGLSQRIRVENLNSGRIVEGVVRSREHVEVLLSRDTNFSNAGPKVSPRVADTRFSNNDR